MFADGGARRWAVVASLIETAKLNGVEPYAWLRDVLRRWLTDTRSSVSTNCCPGSERKLYRRFQRSAVSQAFSEKML